MTAYELVAKISLDTSEYESGLSGASSKFSTFGSKVKKGLGTAMKVGAAAVATIGTATVAAGAVITKATGKVAEYGDNIDKMSQKMGISSTKYQEWQAVLKHSGTSMESMKAGMKTLANAAEKNNEAFGRLGITQEQIANMSQEELFEATIAGLQGVENTTERTYLAGQLLGRGATELGALLNTSAEDTQKMRDRVHELGGVMSEEAVKASAKYQDTLQDLQTSMQGLTRNTVGQFLPSMTLVMEGLTSIFAGEGGGVKKITDGVDGIIDTVGQSAPKFFTVIGTVGSGIMTAINSNLPQITESIFSGVTSMGEGIMKAIPSIASSAQTILSTLMTSIMEVAPQLAESGSEIIGQLASGLSEGIPTFLESILPMMLQLSEQLRANAGTMIDAGLNLLVQLAQGIANGLPVLIAYLPQIISNIANIINDNAPKVLLAGVKIIVTLAQGIVNALPAIKDNFLNILKMIFDVVMAFNWVSLGGNIITFISNGVKSLATTIPQALQNIGQTAMEWLSAVQWSTLGADIIDLILIGLESLASALPAALKAIATTAVNAFKAVPWLSIGKAALSMLVTGIRGMAGGVVNAIKRPFNLGKNIIKNYFKLQVQHADAELDKLKAKVKSKLDSVRNTIKGILDKVKGFFPLKIGNIFSGMKLPHFSVSGSPPFGIGGKGTKPSISVKWYKKALEEPYLFSNATLFGAGEAGDEMLYGRQSLLDDISSVVNGQQENSFGRAVQITNYITVEGAEDPEDFAERFIRKLKLDMRTA